jgi:hypothetical protein
MAEKEILITVGSVSKFIDTEDSARWADEVTTEHAEGRRVVTGFL